MGDAVKLDDLIALVDALADTEVFSGRGDDLIFTTLKQDLQKVKDKATSKEERQKIEKSVENLAKALPGMTKGTLSAITAFQKGDAISGSAAIMDICSSLAPLLGGLAAAGGPPGMLVGAIFSIVGQILSFFAPQSESLTQKIEELLKKRDAKKTQAQILRVHETISLYNSTLREAAKRVSRVLDKPRLNVEVTREIVQALNPLEGNTVDNFKEVRDWLEDADNQGLDLWPTILCAWCQAWADMIVASLTLLSLVHTERLQKQYDEAEKLADRQEGHAVNSALINLQASVISRLIILKSNNHLVLQALKRLAPAAQNRGMLWLIADSHKGQTYAGTNIKKGVFSDLGGEGKTISVVVPEKDKDEPRPTYYVFGVEKWGTGGYDRTYISKIEPPYERQNGEQLVDAKGQDYAGFHGLSDIWAEPGHKPDEIWFYTAKGKLITGYVVDVKKGMNKASPSGYTLTMLKADFTSVRVLHKPQSFLDDPENTPGILTDVDGLAYGGLARENRDIYVDFGGEGKSGYVHSPWGGYDRLGVDQHYLWVFGSGGFACATHASVVRCIKEKKDEPRWMKHFPNALLYVGNQNPYPYPSPRPKPLVGLVDLCPCEDGTLVASIYQRSVELVTSELVPEGDYAFVDKNALFSAVYSTDLKKQQIEVKWTKIPDSAGVRVQKLPVFGWPLFERLPVALNELAPKLAAL